MRYIVVFLILVFFSSCETEESAWKFYQASAKENSALLQVQSKAGQFYGHCKIQYAEGVVDSGEVRGIVAGDTLRGIFNYVSYGGTRAVKPFLLLKSGDTLKQASGTTYTYLEIPYYFPKSIQFKKSNFQFLPIASEKYKELEGKMKK
ncbi:hypothetical protein [Flavobacterium sp.]|uniref:hypothetical protein n=1 Tax=Flavobacterium sp. TaxID=239 RepID=UPI0028BF26E4|nr:hypothetical protein [Flavobacterium sp.]